MGNITKLPLWAQTHIGVLERRNRVLQDQLAELHGDPATSRAYSGWTTADRVAIPADLPVVFRLPGDRQLGFSVRMDWAKGQLLVSSLRSVLLIQPEAANAIRVMLRP